MSKAKFSLKNFIDVGTGLVVKKKEEEYLTKIIELFEHAEAAYKRLQQYTHRVDSQIQNEYRYTARAVIGILKYQKKSIISSSLYSAEIKNYIENFHESTKHIVNDSIDFTVKIAQDKVLKLDREFSVPLISVYPHMTQLVRATAEVNLKIAKSRNVGGFERINMYKEIIESKAFHLITDFLDEFPVIYSAMKQKQKGMLQVNMISLAQLTITGLILLFAALSFFLKYSLMVGLLGFFITAFLVCFIMLTIYLIRTKKVNNNRVNYLNSEVIKHQKQA